MALRKRFFQHLLRYCCTYTLFVVSEHVFIYEYADMFQQQ